MQLCVFDSRRGQQEGHELDKVLFFYPLDCPLPSQLSLVGLSEGLITFSRIFSPDSPCEFMEAERHGHIFYECEPDIWMILVVEKDGDQVTRDGAYRSLLRELYGIFRLFYGKISSRLENNPVADVVRNCLYVFVPDYIGDMMAGKTLWLPTISDSLAEHATVRILSVEPDILLECQSLLGLLESWSGVPQQSMVLFHNYLISSTLLPADTMAMYTYAVLRMIPSVVSQSFAQGSKRSYTRHSVLNSVVSTFVTEPKRSVSSLHEQTVSQPLHHDAWWQDVDGFLSSFAWGADGPGGGAVIPSVWLQEGEKMTYLCVYQHRALTLLMFIPSAESVALLRKQIIDQADKIQVLEEKLTKQWGGSNAMHVPGYRYMHHDLSRRTIKASPPNKVATLAKESLAVLNKVRGELDKEKNRSDHTDKELCLRTKNNAWVSARARAGHELYVVLEKASDTLLVASDAIDKFNKRHCEGRLSSD
ncbi:hypothetical protein SELMODRAFT_416490 [Selaginella moellendorffii]|uniref:CCZ1/INTU/HSP4 first Longin domain-containing protein n=1 Tax=Selaginella moellendorffii TaxID=88036 RepID=D8RZF9_SELML|nr:vacuolar fusion protein CCZ1 homolog [Selaginella moellendorffii]EFJ22293.1 hypothetical protein SELMODRAFT_416490 [Selaginella moellendorffii]|eukprot:XP_002976624.1 vacuolar fusion protein CCZ1 homolog [Selaginella moellendorffii]